MFRCQVSGKLSKPGDKQFKLVTHVRIRRDGGVETVKELSVCEEVFNKHALDTPVLVADASRSRWDD